MMPFWAAHVELARREREEVRATLIHEFGHALLGHELGVPLKGISVLWSTRAQTHLDFTTAVAAGPLRPWRSIYAMIALAGVVAYQMTTIAQPTAETVAHDLARPANAEDGKAVAHALERPYVVADLVVPLGDVKALLWPHTGRLTAVAERQADLHIAGLDRPYSLDGPGLVGALTGQHNDAVPPSYEPLRSPAASS